MRLAAVVLLVCTFVSTASAQPGQTPPAPNTYQPPPQPYPQPATRTDRYGTTIAIVDGVSMAAIVVGAIIVVAEVIDNDNSSDSDAALGVALMVGGGVGLIAGGPYVHYSKGNSSSAWKSLALRIGLPLAGSLIGAAIEPDCDASVESCDQDGSSLGGVGFLAAMIIDWVWLAKREVAVTYAYPSPYVGSTRDGGLTFGLAGSF